MAACTTDHPAYTVPVAKFVKNEAENPSLEKGKMDQYRNNSNKAFAGHIKEAKDDFPLQKIDSVKY